MTDAEKDAELARLRRTNRRNTRQIVFMIVVILFQAYVGIDGLRTLRRTSALLDQVADQRDEVNAENAKFREALRKQKDEEDAEIRRGVWVNLPWFVSQLDDTDIAKLRALHKRQMQPPPPPPVTH